MPSPNHGTLTNTSCVRSRCVASRVGWHSPEQDCWRQDAPLPASALSHIITMEDLIEMILKETVLDETDNRIINGIGQIKHVMRKQKFMAKLKKRIIRKASAGRKEPLLLLLCLHGLLLTGCYGGCLALGASRAHIHVSPTRALPEHVPAFT